MLEGRMTKGKKSNRNDLRRKRKRARDQEIKGRRMEQRR